MDRIYRSFLSLSLLLSFYTITSHPYWPEQKGLEYLLRDTSNAELGRQILAHYTMQNNYAQSYQREMKATYRVGQTISIITPYDNRGAFCQWQFLFHGRPASYDEGIRKLEQSGLVYFTGYSIDNHFCTEMWSADFPCDAVDQMTMSFVAAKPGKIIFYMKNKEYENYGVHGCSCKPTVTKFEITIVENSVPTYHYLQ